jgi:hypothetical protein
MVTSSAFQLSFQFVNLAQVKRRRKNKVEKQSATRELKINIDCRNQIVHMLLHTHSIYRHFLLDHIEKSLLAHHLMAIYFYTSFNNVHVLTNRRRRCRRAIGCC